MDDEWGECAYKGVVLNYLGPAQVQFRFKSKVSQTKIKQEESTTYISAHIQCDEASPEDIIAE